MAVTQKQFRCLTNQLEHTLYFYSKVKLLSKKALLLKSKAFQPLVCLCFV